jgi:hypothetical protein
MKNYDLTYKLDRLKKEYIALSLGAMVYDADTKVKRDSIAEEIERLETIIAE